MPAAAAPARHPSVRENGPVQTRRLSVVLGASVGALLIGGVAQAYAWRWGADWLVKVTNSQFAWLLLCFVVAAAWTGRRRWSGALAGALTGLGLIASYYAVQWLADGWESASSQFSSSFGLAWSIAAIAGGGLAGALGSLASASADHHPVRSAFALSTAALLTGLGPLASSVASAGRLTADGMWVAIAFYASIGAGLLVIALRRYGIGAFLRGLALAAPVSSALLAALFLLQRTVLYPTF